MEYRPKFSVIVPIYNAELYLKKCIESILEQDFTDVELVLVDDGSEDSSGTICDKYAEEDPRIEVVHKKNEGLGSSRVAGLIKAKGEYICFVDSDDWIDIDLLGEADRVIKRNSKADILVGGYVIDRNNETNNPFMAGKSSVMSNTVALEKMFDAELFDWSLCDKFYKKELFTDELLANWPRGYGEDTYANWVLFNNAREILYAPFYKYHYYMHMDSMTHQVFSRKKFDYFKVYDSILMQLNRYDKRILGSVCSTALKVCVPIIYSAEREYVVYSKEIQDGLESIHSYYEKIKTTKHNTNYDILDNELEKINKDRTVLEKQFKDEEKSILEFVSENTVYVYGAGIIAEEVISLLEKLNIKIKGILVSQKQKMSFFCGYKVYAWEELKKDVDTTKIILALNKKNTAEVIKTVQSRENIEMFDAGKFSINYL